MEYHSAVKKKRNNVICSNMDGPRDHTEWSKSDREGEILYDTPYMWNLKRNDLSEHTYKTETDSQTSRVSQWEGWEEGRVREIGWTCTHYYILNE